MWDLIVSVPDHCLSFYFATLRKILCLCSVVFRAYIRVKLFT